MVTCLISLSDNYAHHLLVDYFGYNNFSDYSISLNTTYKVRESDYLGYIDVNDAFQYLNKVYPLIVNSNFLQGIFNNSVYNFLNIDDMSFYHKYGMYGEYYHDVGISIGNNPYYLVVLSKEINNI